MISQFKVYDIFAILVPGVLFNCLLVLTFKHFLHIEIFNWAGGFGDATLLIAVGYAAGVFLQAIGKAIIEPIWLRLRGGQPTATLLMKKSSVLSDNYKSEILKVLFKTYGEIPANDGNYKKKLEETTYRAYKNTSFQDPKVERFFAEHHAMRAYVACFLFLTTLVLIGGFINITLSCEMVAVSSGLFFFMAVFATWRMEDKAVTLAKHVLTEFAKKILKEKEDGG